MSELMAIDQVHTTCADKMGTDWEACEKQKQKTTQLLENGFY